MVVMDPLSISASVVAVATLAANVCSAIADLRSLCQSLPGRLHAVNNEVADLEFVLFQVALLAKERISLPDGKGAIPHLLKKATTSLIELKAVVKRLTLACQNAKMAVLAAKAWRNEQANLQELQEGIKNIKCDLNIMLGVTNSQDMMSIRLNVESISAVTDQSAKEQLEMKDKVVSGLSAVDERVARVEAMLRTQAELLQQNQFKQVGPLYNMSVVRKRRPILAGCLPEKVSASESFGVQVTPYAVTCRPGCPCHCHKPQKSSSPALVNRIFGQLFVGYTGLPVISPKCNFRTCQKSRSSHISLEYWFPLGFFSSTIVRMQLGYQPNVGTLFQLDTLRRVPDTAQCVNFALHGDIEGLKHLFASGLASPRDVSTTRGYSLLRWALYGKQYETCQFLLTAGADPDYRPIAETDNNPRNKACHFLLEGSLPNDGVDALRAITRGGYFEDFIDQAKFTQTHRIVLGLSLLSLEEEIIMNPQDINAPDAMGRTPLAWAAAKGDSKTIAILLSYGADPNMIDVQASGPVSNAAARGHTTCVRLLLEAGALADHPISDSQRKGSPLNCAARNAEDVLLLKCLLDFGANVESCGVDGQTPLIHAARNDNSSFAMLLLEYGANINAVSAIGATPLTTAITFNSHNVLRLILDRWHEYAACPRLQGPHLLQIVSLYADVETMNILTASDHLRSKYDSMFTLGDYGDRLARRPDFTEKLALAFEDLLTVINRTPGQNSPVEDFLEAGFSRHHSSPAMGNGERGCLGGICQFVPGFSSRTNTSVDFVRPDSGSDIDSEDSFKDALDQFQPVDEGCTLETKVPP